MHNLIQFILPVFFLTLHVVGAALGNSQGQEGKYDDYFLSSFMP